MAKLLKLRRGTTTQHASFTGAEGEVTIDTTKDTAVVHDGSTAGGTPLAKENMANVSSANIVGRISASALAGTKVQPNFGTQDIETTGNIDLSDSTGSGNNRIKIGTGDDLEIYHLASNNNSYITETGSGNLVIGGDMVNLTNAATTESYIRCTGNGQVELYHDNNKKLETFGNGIIVYGPESGGGLINIYADEGDDNADKWRLHANPNGSFYLQNYTSGSWENNLAATGNAGTSLYYDNAIKFETTSGGASVSGRLSTDGVYIGDGGNTDVSLSIGASNDLRLYHDGSNSYITERGTGDLFIRNGNDDAIRCRTDDAVELYHDNVKKFETTSGGVAVTGNIIPDANNTRNIGDGTTNFNSIWASNRFRGNDSVYLGLGNSIDLKIRHDGTDNLIEAPTGMDLKIMTGTNDNANETCATFDNNGAVKLYYDNSQKLETTSWGTQISGTLKTSGGGISILNDGEKFTAGASDDLEIYHSGTNSIINNTQGELQFLTDAVMRLNSTEYKFNNAANSEKIANFHENGGCELYYDHSKKFETTSGGAICSGTLTVTSGAYSYITMGDSDHGDRSIHNNSNQIGFLQQNGQWGAYCDDNGNWTASGNVTAYSDSRLKTDISTINDALGIVGKLRGVSYKWLRDGSDGIGVIAQEVEEVIPSVVVTNQVEGLDGIEEVKSVDYGKIVGVLINAINELKEELEIHKAECAKHHGGQ